jgi:hypothetical protein
MFWMSNIVTTQTMNNSSNHWWHDDMSELASSLPKGALNDMRRRILSSNIQREKLALNESTDRMKQFFEREILRVEKRRQKALVKEDQLDVYRSILKKLLKCNVELKSKCQKNNIQVTKIPIHGKACSWH